MVSCATKGCEHAVKRACSAGVNKWVESDFWVCVDCGLKTFCSTCVCKEHVTHTIRNVKFSLDVVLSEMGAKIKVLRLGVLKNIKLWEKLKTIREVLSGMHCWAQKLERTANAFISRIDASYDPEYESEAFLLLTNLEKRLQWFTGRDHNLLSQSDLTSTDLKNDVDELASKAADLSEKFNREMLDLAKIIDDFHAWAVPVLKEIEPLAALVNDLDLEASQHRQATVSNKSSGQQSDRMGLSVDDSSLAQLKIPDAFLADVFGYLGLKDKLVVSSVCKQFFLIVFESHKSRLWRNVQISACNTGFRTLLKKCSECTQSLELRDLSLTAFEKEVPKMISVTRLSLHGDYVLSTKMLSALADVLPNLRALKCQKITKRCVDRFDMICAESGMRADLIPEFLPKLEEFTLSDLQVYIHSCFEMGEFEPLLCALACIPRVSIERICLMCVDHSVQDRLAVSNVAGGIRELKVITDSVRSYDGKPYLPKTSMGCFPGLKHVHINGKDQDLLFLATIAELRQLETLILFSCRGVNTSWSSTYSFTLPISLSTIILAHCGTIGNRVIQCIAQLSGSIKNVIIDSCEMQFSLAAGINDFMITGAPAVEYMYIDGTLLPDHNATDELVQVSQCLIDNADVLAGLEFFCANLRWERQVGGFQEEPQQSGPALVLPDGCVLNVLHDRLPNCIAKFANWPFTKDEERRIKVLDGWQKSKVPSFLI